MTFIKISRTGNTFRFSSSSIIGSASLADKTVSGTPISSSNKIVDASGFKQLYGSVNNIPTVGIDDEYASFNTADYSADGLFNHHTNTLVAAITEAKARGINRVLLRPTTGVYNFSGLGESQLDGITIEGFDMFDCVVESPDGASVPVFRVSGSVGADRFGLWNLTVDGNSSNQDFDPGNSATWFSPVQLGQTDNVWFKNLKVKDAVKHCVLLTGGTGANISGTATFSRGSRIVTGSGTDFTSLNPGQYLRSADTGYATMPIAKINSETELVLTYPWQHDSETGVGLKFGVPCENPLFENVILDTNLYDDLLGGGLWNAPTFTGFKALDGAGYGLGCTQIFKGNFSQIFTSGNTQGLGLERAVACNFDNIVTENNTENGLYAINGCFDININNICTRNNDASGFLEGLTVVGGKRKMHNSGVVVNNVVSEHNGEHGVRCSSSVGTKITNGSIINNGQSGGASWHGVVATGDATESIKDFTLSSLRITDNQATKTQKFGVFLSTFSEKKSISISKCNLEGNSSGEIHID